MASTDGAHIFPPRAGDQRIIDAIVAQGGPFGFGIDGDFRRALGIFLSLSDAQILTTSVDDMWQLYLLDQGLVDTPDPFTFVLSSPMAFPTRESNTGDISSGTSETHTVAMPTGVVSGDLLVIIFGTRTAPTITEPANWTKISQSTGSNTAIAVMYKVSDGTEGADEIVATGVPAVNAAWEVYRISGAANPASQAPEVAYAFADVDETDGDPPNLTPTGGAKNYLWFTAAFKRDDGNVTAFPGSYTNTGFEKVALAPAVIGFAERTLNASSENPGVFSWGVAADWTAVTIAIHPVS